MATDNLRILVVDDSALYRQLVRNVLREVPGVEVAGTAKSGEEALALVAALDPDLLTLDVQMPGLSGIDVLRGLKSSGARTKAIMLSSLTAAGAQTTTDALLEGAFDFILKPGSSDAEANRRALCEALAEKVAAFRESHALLRAPGRRSEKLSRPAEFARRAPEESEGDASESIEPPAECRAVVVGTSTGGPVALRELVPNFPADLPVPVLIVQHMPPQYTRSLAERLNDAARLRVVEGEDGMRVSPGWVYLAPGGRHMKVGCNRGQTILRITDDPAENSVRPSVDYLFRSAAETFEGKLIAVVMTGMGRDGVEGCREIRRRGGYVVTQHAHGCVVYGMPKAVVDEGLSDRIIPLELIAGAVTKRVRRGRPR